MKIRTRLTIWYAVLLILGLIVIAGCTYYEMFVEHPLIVQALKRQGHTPIEEVSEIILYGGVPALAVALMGSWFLMRRALSPVSRLTHEVERMHAENLHQQFTASGKGDELDRLTDVFNAMTRRLDDSFQRIRDFTLHASHELKTPLTVIRAELDDALHDSDLSSAERERCARLLEEIERLTQIVDGLNFITKADAGLLTLEKNFVRLDELVTDARDDAQVLAQSNEIRVDLETCEPVGVTGDRRRLRQLLLILTDNAIKYNRPAGRVAIELRRQGAQAVLTVTNTGPGIAPEVLEKVFDRFFRGDASHNSQVEGCGLGLTIAQGIVRAHAGEIHIASKPELSTTVTVELPVAVEAKETRRELPEDNRELSRPLADLVAHD